jgi:hypothetical protein
VWPACDAQRTVDYTHKKYAFREGGKNISFECILFQTPQITREISFALYGRAAAEVGDPDVTLVQNPIQWI